MDDYGSPESLGAKFEYAPTRGAEFFDWLGYAIGRSTKLRELALHVCDGEISCDTYLDTRPAAAKDSGWHGYDIGNGSALKELLFSWYDVFNNHLGMLCQGLSRNTSLHKIAFRNLQGDDVLRKMDGFFRENAVLEDIELERCDLGADGCRLLSRAVKDARNLKRFRLSFDEGQGLADDGFLEDVINALRQHNLQELRLAGLTVGERGCRSVAGLLRWAVAGMSGINFSFGRAGDGKDGADVFLCMSINGNGIMRDISLQLRLAEGCDPGVLDFARKRVTPLGWSALSRTLCNTKSVNETYLSNHTLRVMYCNGMPVEQLGKDVPEDITGCLKLNSTFNESQVSIIKILKFHPNFDANMAPFFTRGFKLLPHVIRWYDRASVCPKLRVGVRMDMDLRKLSTIFQFIRGLPLLYVASMSEREIEEIRKRKVELHRERLNLSLKLEDAEGRVREVEQQELRAARRL